MTEGASSADWVITWLIRPISITDFSEEHVMEILL